MLSDYISQASQYVSSPATTLSDSKTTQCALAGLLSRSLLADLQAIEAPLSAPEAGEITIHGGLRSAKVDVVDRDHSGIRLSIEGKPIYRAAKRTIWNRFGDAAFANLNVHLRHPFAVTGYLLTIPTWSFEYPGFKQDTYKAVQALRARIRGVGKRTMPTDPPHLAEAIGLVVYDPETREMLPGPFGYEEFLSDISRALSLREML